MRAGGSNLQTNAFGSTHQFAAGAMHGRCQFSNVAADFGAYLNDGLVHLGLYLLAQALRSCCNQLADVRAQLSRSRINDLKLFFDTYSEPVIHVRPFRSETRGFRHYHTRSSMQLHTWGWDPRASDERSRGLRTSVFMRERFRGAIENVELPTGCANKNAHACRGPCQP